MANMVPVLRALGGFIGFLLFMYALTTALAAVFAIFEVARWFDTYRSSHRDQRSGSKVAAKQQQRCADPSDYLKSVQ